MAVPLGDSPAAAPSIAPSFNPAVPPSATVTKDDQVGSEEDEDEDDHDGDLTEDIREVALQVVSASPPWLVSFTIHLVLMIIFALIFIPMQRHGRVEVEMVFSDQKGEQLVDDDLDLGFELPDTMDAPVLTADELPVVEAPLAAPSPLKFQDDSPFASAELTTPNIGVALTGREAGMKDALLAAYGGTMETERAVTEALKWLKRNQQRNGSWSLKGPYSDGAFEENEVAATAMALLAFQGNGNTHRAGTYQKEVELAWQYVLKNQQKNGSFASTEVPNHQLYTHAQVTIALCELFGMTRDEKYRQPALDALDYAINTQSPKGGWRYIPRTDSDMSVTGWFVMAFQSAMMAGLRAPSPTLEGVEKFLDSVSNKAGDRYSYVPGRGPTPAMTAEALLCRQYLGWSRDDPRLQSGAAFLLENPINERQRNVYYWYYATQVLHHLDGPAWEEWNLTMRSIIPQRQETVGDERGSWDPNRDEWGSQGGRLFTTCLCTYMLEVYYRHLPIYGFNLQ